MAARAPGNRTERDIRSRLCRIRKALYGLIDIAIGRHWDKERRLALVPLSG